MTRPVDLLTMPIYVRAGAIIPFDPVRQHTGEKVSEPTSLRIYGGADGEFTLYEDDGISQDYLRGRGTWTRIAWNDRTKRLTIEPARPAGATNVAIRRVFRIRLMPGGATKDASYAGRRVQVSLSPATGAGSAFPPRGARRE